MISQKAILGQDCELEIETDLFTGAFLQWDSFDGRIEKVQSDFNVAASTVEMFTMPKDRVAPFTIRCKRGLNTTFKDFETKIYGKTLSNFAMTDWPDHDYMTGKYGPLVCVSVAMNQTEAAGTADATFRYGGISHGYTVV